MYINHRIQITGVFCNYPAISSCTHCRSVQSFPLAKSLCINLTSYLINTYICHFHKLKKKKKKAFWSKAWQMTDACIWSKELYNRNTSLAFPPIQLLPCTDYSLVTWCSHLTVRPETFLAYKTLVLRYLNGIIHGDSCAPIQGRAADTFAEVC